MRTLILTTLAAASLAACASNGPQTSSLGNYGQELAELQAQCNGRNGMLVPVPNATTGRPATDYVCDVKGVGSPRVTGRDASTR
jgi:hypothetical protein